MKDSALPELLVVLGLALTGVSLVDVYLISPLFFVITAIGVLAVLLGLVARKWGR